ncbi:MAG: MaoC family dehydratase [Firmicutes bacterium]|nr:MaoC family dehydratase [Bacillota bacterium]
MNTNVENLRAGAQLFLGEKGPVTRVQIARFAGATLDFNPVHVDEPFAQTAGMPSVIAHGPLLAGFLAGLLEEQFGFDVVRKISCRLTAPVFPGDVLRFSATVADLDPQEPDLRVLQVKALKADETQAALATVHLSCS